MNFFEHIEGLLASKFEIAKGFWTLLKLESKLAGLSIIPFIISIGMLAAIIMTFWFAVMVMIGYLITYFSGGYVFLSIVSILLLNILFLLVTIKYLSVCLYRMSFARTRACLISENEIHEGNQITKVDS